MNSGKSEGARNDGRTAAGDRDVLDLEASLARVHGNKELLGRIFKVFVQEAPNKLARCREALDRNDLREVEYLAHAIKGEAMAISASRARDTAARMEKSAESGDGDTSRELYGRLADEVAQVLRIIGLTESGTPRDA
jgi:HPt (histidine-containing phosphotransfer) domain-containing protein